jgi:hypothetical protein
VENGGFVRLQLVRAAKLLDLALVEDDDSEEYKEGEKMNLNYEQK